MNSYPAFISEIYCKNNSLFGSDNVVRVFINNVDKTHISFYLLEDIEKQPDLQQIIEKWWNETHRKFPVNIIFEKEMRKFKFLCKIVNKNYIVDVVGNKVSLNDILYQRGRNIYKKIAI